MSDGDRKQVGATVDSDVWRAFREDVKARRGGIHGLLGEELDRAIRAYLDASDGGDTHDRLTRIEQKLDDLRGDIEATEKKQDSDISATVENRLEKIRETIREEAGDAPRVHEKVIESAIEHHAGRSDPTLRQYKNLLQEDRDLFPDPRPSSSHYFRDAERFTVAVNTMVEDGEITERDYVDIVEDTYSREWWGEKVRAYKERNDLLEDGGERGFQ